MTVSRKRGLIAAEVWEQLGRHLRQPRRIRIEREGYEALTTKPETTEAGEER